MNKGRDNKIVREIIDGKISELYCIKEGYNGLNCFNFGKKYKVFFTRQIKPDTVYDIWIEVSYITHILLEPDTYISDYFEVYGIRKIRKDKIKKLNSYGCNLPR